MQLYNIWKSICVTGQIYNFWYIYVHYCIISAIISIDLWNKIKSLLFLTACMCGKVTTKQIINQRAKHCGFSLSRQFCLHVCLHLVCSMRCNVKMWQIICFKCKDRSFHEIIIVMRPPLHRVGMKKKIIIKYLHDQQRSFIY